ncbi:hypothetical protein JOC31_000220 [Streptococcus saliviloxodontae]|uniref:Uncharacterized protein n=1 Tax=Streptococcus saliviloxodontae TaxID=1349416 RepID=A0ABS2PKU2_9STRE|nr:hypothetical protein [Streptococcus saliviloxodontae]
MFKLNKRKRGKIGTIIQFIGVLIPLLQFIYSIIRDRKHHQ